MAVATFFVIILYTCFTFSYTELACAIPKAGGAFDYAKRAMGKDWGFITGMAQNIECVGCGSRFNVAFWHGRFVMAQRIPSEKDGGGTWREDMFPKVLE